MRNAWARPPASRIDVAVASAPAWLRSSDATIAPSAPNRFAVALPMPDAAPVTPTTLPSNRSAVLTIQLSSVLLSFLARSGRLFRPLRAKNRLGCPLQEGVGVGALGRRHAHQSFARVALERVAADERDERVRHRF